MATHENVLDTLLFNGHDGIASDGSTDAALDSVNNNLQQAMQLLYRLARNTGIPEHSRHHVAEAQAELALLGLEMRIEARRRGKSSAGGITTSASG